VKSAIPDEWKERLRGLQFAASLSHLTGLAHVDVKPSDACVTCLIKNGSFYIDQFVGHYSALGFKHLFFLDNGSTDDTVARASRHRNVTVFRSTLPVSRYQGLMKREFAKRCVPNGWCLDVDIDEFFEYPYASYVPLQDFIGYLNDHAYTAVVTQMLDMFADRPLGDLAGGQAESLKDVHCYYDLSAVVQKAYVREPLTLQFGRKNLVATDSTALCWGGIRATIWGFNCLLTKHSLFRTNAGLRLFPHVHYVDRAKLADVSGVLRHYKFASNAKAEASQNRAAFSTNSRNYERVLETIAERPDVRIRGAHARTYSSPEALLESGFLFASRQFEQQFAVT